jgi:hypothetical protein
MKNLSSTIAIAAALLAGPMATQTLAQQAPQPQSSPSSTGSFGKSNDFDAGKLFENVYVQNFYCDTSVPAQSSSGCEVGTTFNKPPAPQYDPLYITVPLGFTVPMMQMQCPSGLVCVDHPPTIDESAIGGPGNAPTPGHDHFTTTLNNYKPEWWDVVVIGVKNRQTYYDIKAHGSYAYIQSLLKAKNPYVVGPVPTNLFLYFGVEPLGSF